MDIPSFKVNVDFTVSTNNSPAYYYWNEDGTREFIYLAKGINTLPINYASKSNDSHLTGSGFHDSFCDSVIIEQIPEYQGSVVTDGVDDIIQSNDSIKDILSNSNKITVLSMIKQLDKGNQSIIRTNFIGMAGSNSDTWVNNLTSEIGTTGIYGYSVSDLNNSSPSIISNILGDDHLYTVDSKIDHSVLPNFTVNGFVRTGDHIDSVSSVAWYWTLIANDVLTKDEIELLISYYDLDRWIRPIAYYNPKRQGLTNDNHTEFNDKLLDLSGNGYDIKLNNMSWSLGSGIGKYNTDFSNGNIWTHFVYINSVSSNSFSYNRNEPAWVVLSNTELTNSTDVLSFKIKVSGLLSGQIINYRYYTSNGTYNDYTITEDGEYILPPDIRTSKPDTSNTSGFRIDNKTDDNEIIVTLLPEDPFALVLDGIDDYGCTEINVPELKDYTIITDRQWLTIDSNCGGIISKTDSANNGAFILEQGIYDSETLITWSFGTDFINLKSNTLDRLTIYQSKYNYYRTNLSLNNISSDSDRPIFIGKVRKGDQRVSNVAIYYILLYPYSMSEFLMNRQLKKYNLKLLS